MSLKLNSSGGGSVTLQEPVTASTLTLNLPAFSGTVANLAAVTNNGVLYVNSSGQPTSGSALVFDGSSLTLGSATKQLGTTNNFWANSPTGANGGIGLSPDSKGAGSHSLVSYIGGSTFTQLNLEGSQIGFYLGTTGLSSEQMRLTSTGLGIGTSSVTAKLVVAGGGLLGTNSTNPIAFTGSSGDNAGIGSYNANTDMNIYAAGTGKIKFRAGATWSSAGVLTAIGPDLAVLDASGNLGLGVTPSASWGSAWKAFEGPLGSFCSTGTGDGKTLLSSNAIENTTNGSSGAVYRYSGTHATQYEQGLGKHIWKTAGTGTAGNAITFTQAMTLDASGNLLVGTTTNYSTRLVSAATNNAFAAINTTAASATAFIWNQATSSNNLFLEFETEGTLTTRGSISYNRAGGLTSYNTTSDYRSKDITGPMTDSGAVIDSVPVYMGKMKGATQERPMFIAHEVPAYAHTGEKDAVDADGNPVYQQMDASALVPVMWAEIQSLRQRLAAAGI